MNAPNTTPGPWTYDQTVCITGSEHLPCVVDAYGLVVAECQDDGHSEIECEANAHLIAASPTMYDYIERKAAGGCEEARMILEAINVRL
jgi:hypothetical protein